MTPDEERLREAIADLQHSNPTYRWYAVRRLAKIGGEEAVVALLGALEDADAEVRSLAALSLGALADDGQAQANAAPPMSISSAVREMAVAGLLRTLEDELHWVRLHAAMGLAGLRHRLAVPALVERVRGDPSDWVRAECIHALNGIGGPEAVDAVLGTLADPSPLVLAVACGVLGELREPRAAEPLLGLVDHEDWDVAHRACSGCVALGVANEGVVRAVERLSESPDEIYLMMAEAVERGEIDIADYGLAYRLEELLELAHRQAGNEGRSSGP